MSATGFNRRRRELDEQKNKEIEAGEDFIEDEEDVVDLTEKTVAELKAMAKEKGLEGCSNMKKTELIDVLAGE